MVAAVYRQPQELRTHVDCQRLEPGTLGPEKPSPEGAAKKEGTEGMELY